MRLRDERPKQPVHLKEDERKVLKKITAKRTEKYNIVLRAKIILMADEGMKFQDIAQKLEIRKDTVTDWTVRWHNTSDKPVQERLMDLPRSGAPDTFTPKQLCQIIAISCESPETYERPITHWTPRELADEVINQDIVESISPRHLGRLLKKMI